MRVNIYAEEMTQRVEVVEKDLPVKIRIEFQGHLHRAERFIGAAVDESSTEDRGVPA